MEPFDIAAVEAPQPGSESELSGDAGAANESAGDESATGDSVPEKTKEDAKETAPGVTVAVDMKTNMLSVRADEKLVAAYPVTIGSERTASPIGDWKIQGIAKMPTFRYDEKMLNEGERSDDFHMLPPGPNNPVGVMWIA
ncbi:MAG: L,D-transpeptidase, partial [Chthoniobacterales bacterium]|nr:L,D-transpeptidase [Chthoniobacterales bacterium]